MRLIALIFLALTVSGSAIAQGASIAYSSFSHTVTVKLIAEKGAPGAYGLSLPLPTYPTEMLRARLHGDAEISFVIQKDGSVTDVKVVAATQREFSEPAVAAVMRWKFRAPTDTSATARMRCRILFKMEDEE